MAAPSRDLKAGLLGADSAADAPVGDAVVIEPLCLPADGGSADAPRASEAAATFSSASSKTINLLMVITFMDAVEYGVVMPSLWAYLLDVLASESGAPLDPAAQPANASLLAADASLGSGWLQNGTVPGDHGHAHYTSGTAHSYYGLIIASFSFTSMLVKPFLGAWCDRRSFKEVFFVTLLIAIGGNVLYAFAGFFQKWELLLAGRLLSGAGCANSALSYAYVSRTVAPDARSGSLAKISLAFPLGMVMGPAFNAITGALDFQIGSFRVDSGNSPGLLVAILMLVELLLLLFMLPEPPPYAAAPTPAPTPAPNPIAHAASVSQAADHGSGSGGSNSGGGHGSGGAGTGGGVGSWPVWEVVGELASAQALACFVTVFTFNFAIGASEALVTPITRAAFGWTPLQNSYVFLGISCIMIIFNLLVMRLSRSPLAPLRAARDKIKKAGAASRHVSALTELEKLVATDDWPVAASAALKAVREDSNVKKADADALEKVLSNPPRRAGPCISDHSFVIGACFTYFMAVTYVLLVWRYEMSIPIFLTGEVLLLWFVPFVFAPNRAIYSRLTDGSRNQGLHQSLLSIMASAGGIAGPVWLGVSVGVPELDAAGKSIGPVARRTFFGAAALVAVTLGLYLFAWARRVAPPARQAANSP